MKKKTEKKGEVKGRGVRERRGRKRRKRKRRRKKKSNSKMKQRNITRATKLHELFYLTIARDITVYI